MGAATTGPGVVDQTSRCCSFYPCRCIRLPWQTWDVAGKADEPRVWELLGVDRHATEAEINAAFRKQAQRVHPDHGGTAGQYRMLIQARDAMLNGAGAKVEDPPVTERPSPPPPADEWDVADERPGRWDDPPPPPPPSPPPPPRYYPPPPGPTTYYSPPSYPPPYYPPPPYSTPSGYGYPPSPPPPPYAPYRRRKRYVGPRGQHWILRFLAHVPTPRRVMGWLGVAALWLVASGVVSDGRGVQQLDATRIGLQIGMEAIVVLLIVAALARRYVRGQRWYV